MTITRPVMMHDHDKSAVESTPGIDGTFPLIGHVPAGSYIISVVRMNQCVKFILII
jgi:hypothetical protein